MHRDQSFCFETSFELSEPLVHADPDQMAQVFLERVIVTTSGSELTCKDVANLVMAPLPDDLRSVSRGAAQQAERARILEALRQVSGNRTRLAKMLKDRRTGVCNKLRAYGLVDAWNVLLRPNFSRRFTTENLTCRPGNTACRTSRRETCWPTSGPWRGRRLAYRTIRTDEELCCTNLVETLPRKNLAIAPSPLAPPTMRSHFTRSAAFRISSAGWPNRRSCSVR